MKVKYARGVLSVALSALVSLPASAQQTSPQTPGTGTATATSAASPLSCAQNSQGITRGIDLLSARVEEARQTNDAAKMRAVIADLEVAFAQMKTQLGDCTTLTAGTGAMANMPGMDHSKMPMPAGAPAMPSGSTVATTDAKPPASMPGMDHSKMPMAPKPATPSGARAPGAGAKPVPPAAGVDHSKVAGAPTATTNQAEASKMARMDHSKMAAEKAAQPPALVFTLHTDPAPLRNGKNDFEVTVRDADGKPIADAQVSLAFYMPPMPSMKMPETRNALTLTSAGNGVYKGTGTIGLAGDWDVTVTASRNGQQLDVKKMKLTVK